MADGAGIMSGAFFVGKAELLKWLNDTFKIGYNKVEEVASGAVHCQILDMLFPGKVPLHKVNFNAKHDYDYVKNYKVLQKVFDEQGIKKHVDVEKLIKAKYQDNLEFLQWMKHLWDTKYNGSDYDAVARREEAARLAKSGGGAATSGLARPSRPTSSVTATKPAAAKPAAVAVKRSVASTVTSSKVERKPAPAASADHDEKDNEKIAELNARLAKFRTTIEGLEKERNFYFGKLREIEVICQTNETEDAPTKAKILEILYATDENAEFEAPVEDSQAVDDNPPAEEEPVDDDLVTY